MKTVIIKKTPNKNATLAGDQLGYGLYTGDIGRAPINDNSRDTEGIRGSYPEVPREEANIEVEKGEFIINNDLGGIYKANGKKHSKGGTPIKAKEGAYVVSDFIKTNPDVLDMLGFKSEGKEDPKQTWAKLLQSKINSKDYNSLAAILRDKDLGKNVDPYAYNTAKNKLPDYQKVVSKIALGNEISKALEGKDFNIPSIAQPALMGLQSNNVQDTNEPMLQAKYGMELPKYQGVTGTGEVWNVPTNIPLPNNLNPYGGDKTWKGNKSKYNQQQIVSKLQGIGYRGDGSVKDAQEWLWNSPDYGNIAKQYHKDSPDGFGMPNSGEYNDNLWGHRWDNIIDAIEKSQPNKRTLPGRTIDPSPELFEQPELTRTVLPGRTVEGDGNPKPVIKQKKAKDIGYDWLDQMTLLESMKRNPTHYPKTFIPDFQQYTPQLEDPNYYPIQAAQRQRGDLMNQFSNAQAARSAMSYQPDQIQGILSENQRVGANNLQTVNQAKQFNTANYNNYANLVSDLRTKDFDKNTLAKVNTETERKLQNQDMLAAMGNMRLNRDQMRMYLSQNPQYGLTNRNDYSSAFGFTSGLGWNSPGQGKKPTFQDNFNSIRELTKGLKPEDAYYYTRMAKLMDGSDDDKPDYTSTSRKSGNTTTKTMKYQRQ